MSKTYEPRKKIINLDAVRSKKIFDKKAERQQGQKEAREWKLSTRLLSVG